MSGGGKHEISKDVKVGGFGSFYYKRDSSMQSGVDDSYWVLSPGAPLTPQYLQGTPSQGDFKTSLYDITRSFGTNQATAGLHTYRAPAGCHVLDRTRADETLSSGDAHA